MPPERAVFYVEIQGAILVKTEKNLFGFDLHKLLFILFLHKKFLHLLTELSTGKVSKNGEKATFQPIKC